MQLWGQTLTISGTLSRSSLIHSLTGLLSCTIGGSEMATKKHLVLDHDVYLRLCKRKRDTGLPLTKIGNAILRTCLDHTAQRVDLLREVMFEAGKLTREEFDELLAKTADVARQWSTNGDELLQAAIRDSAQAGNWAMSVDYRASNGTLMVVECWVRDRRKRPVKSHYHHDDEHVLVLNGSVLYQVREQQHILHTQNTLYIPGGVAHAVTPLSDDARLLLTFSQKGGRSRAT